MSQTAYEEEIDRGEGEHFDSIEEQELDPEMRCVECGAEMVTRCGCCALPLCVRHNETQAGFCSSFGKHKFTPGDYLEITDSENGFKDAPAKCLGETTVNGCLFKTDSCGLNQLIVMEDYDSETEEIVTELEAEKFKVLDE